MKTSNSDVSICRHCQYYEAEGRRGGTCQRLCGRVQGDWKACSLAIPAFASSWELPGIVTWRTTVETSILSQRQIDEASAERSVEAAQLLESTADSMIESTIVAIDRD